MFYALRETVEHDEEEDQPWANLTMREKQQKARYWFGTKIILSFFFGWGQNTKLANVYQMGFELDHMSISGYPLNHFRKVEIF